MTRFKRPAGCGRKIGLIRWGPEEPSDVTTSNLHRVSNRTAISGRDPGAENGNPGIRNVNHMADTSKSNRALENSERKPAPGASKIGDADPKEKLSVSVRVRRRSDAPGSADPNKLTATTFSKRKHLSREEYAA